MIGRRELWWAAIVFGGFAAVATIILTADGIVERGRVAREATVIEQLEDAVLTDAGAASSLGAARELETARSVERKARNRILAWTLLISTSLFLVAAKRFQALGPQVVSSRLALPDLVTLGTGKTLAAALPGGSAAPPPPDLTIVDEIVAREGTGREAAIPILQALQRHYRYLPETALRRVCDLTEVTPADLIGVASFYSQFRRTPVGKHLVRVCHGTACHVAGIGPITDELRRRLSIPTSGDSDPAMRFTLDPVNCLGCCSLAPVLMVDDRVAGRLTPTSAFEVLARAESVVGGES